MIRCQYTLTKSTIYELIYPIKTSTNLSIKENEILFGNCFVLEIIEKLKRVRLNRYGLSDTIIITFSKFSQFHYNEF